MEISLGILPLDTPRTMNIQSTPLLAALSSLILPAAASITSVSETNLGGDAAAVIATGFGEDALTFSDRTHQHNGAAFEADLLNIAGTTIIDLPDYLVGNDYVSFANNARDNVNYEATIQTDVVSEFYLLVDNRINGPAGNNSSPNTSDPDLGGTLQWVIDGGWERVNTGISPNGQGDYTGVDEGGDAVGAGLGLNQFYSVYKHPGISALVTVNSNGLGGNNMISLVAVPAPDANVPIGSFAAVPSVISEGDSASLDWIIHSGITFGTIDQGVGDILPLTTDGNGNVSVSPTVTTTYTLDVETPGGNDSAEVTVTVRLISDFSADTVFIDAGDPVTFSWSTRSDATVTLTDVGSVSAGDSSVTINPTESKTYILTAVSGDETETAEIEILTKSAGLYALLDLGATNGTPQAGALTGAQIGAGAHNENGIDLATTTLTSETGDEFTIAIANVAPDGTPAGRIDWRDRGDSTGNPLTFLGEDLLKNNAGMIRVTLGGLPAGTYEIVSWHYDPNYSQAENIAILTTDANGTAADTGVTGSAAYDFPVSSINNTTENMNSRAEIFSVESNGVDDVILYFDGRAGFDTEVPLNGLQITLLGAASGPEIVNIDFDPATQNLTLEFLSIPGATYGIYAGTDLINFDEERDDNVIGQAGTTTYVESRVDTSVTPKLFYRVQRLD